MKPVVILGGGLTGLVAAERLGAAGREALVVERESEPGGACRSIDREGFTFDYTGHLLHVARPETRAYLADLGVWDAFEVHTRRAAVMVGGRLTPYPIQINTHGLEAEVRRDCVLGFVRAWSEGLDEAERRFDRWVLQRFGDGLARHFFFPYNSKLFRAEPEEFLTDWVGRFVPRPRLEDVIDGAFGLHDAAVGYNATFRYPAQGGIRALPDAVARRVRQIRTGARVTAVHCGERWVETATGERLKYSALISTVPLPAVCDLIVDGLPDEAVQARRALRWVRVVNLALGVDGPAARPEHWIYFPDPELPFYRVGFPSNHGRVAPPGAHTVSVERSVEPGGEVDDAVLSECERALADRGLLDRDRVRVRQVTAIDPAYVVFDERHRASVSTLRRTLNERGLLVAGRWAEWKYSAMEDAVLDGMAAARSADEGRV